VDVCGPSRVEESLNGSSSVLRGRDLLLRPLPVVAVGQGLDEMVVLNAAVGARHLVTVVREEVQPLVWEE
jgi:hypothetical protein